MRFVLLLLATLTTLVTAYTLPASGTISVFLNQVKTGSVSVNGSWTSGIPAAGLFFFSGTPATFTMSTSAGSCYVTTPNAVGELHCDNSGRSTILNSFGLFPRVFIIYNNAAWSANKVPIGNQPQTIFSQAGHQNVFTMYIDGLIP
ncbi:hypothetical protein M422DRAFT_272683 [Sphaerobolus stellatus SS14]|uniref:RNase T2-like C-terminal domain-containing protein n=1 Tax=Sphaerobolus stellatus (strain SS14) TaxID=990650 RepID=A0A0C9UB25_SPHS4|nr:hypothetical protein M422DRAFT_272683 [Sphaerobolus stellatus SS14]